MTPEEIFPIFFGVWIVLGVASWVFYMRANIVVKRMWHPWIVVGTGILFVAFTLLMMPDMVVFAVVVPATALISWLNIKNIKFCDSCGAMLINMNWFTKLEYCQKCGAKIAG